MKNLILLTILMFNVFFLYAAGCMQVPVSLEDRVQNSNLIIEGTVINEYSKWNADKTMIYTYYELQPSIVFKGDAKNVIVIETKGGIIGDNQILVEPSLKMETLMKGVFFLKKDTSGVVKPYAVDQGAFIYNYEIDKAASLFDSYNLSNGQLDEEIIRLSNRQPQFRSKTSLKQNPFANRSAARASVVISNLSHTQINAGTIELLTITGSGFGTERGTQKIGFANADDGGKSNFYPSIGYKSWSDNKIEVYVPYRAGSGTIKFYDGTEVIATSEQTLEINFNRKTVGYVGNYYPIRMVDRSGLGGYSFTVSDEFRNNQDAFLKLKEALAQWSTTSGISWDVNSIVSSNTTTSKDGVNNIMFKSEADIGAGVLGATVTHTAGCRDENGDYFFYLEEMDMYYNKDIDWNFSQENPASHQFDFYTVLLHELGHAHLLGHVVDRNSLMYYSTSKGRVVKEFTLDEILGVQDLVAMSTESVVCGKYPELKPMKTAVASDLEYDSCNNVYNYGGEIQADKWHYITNEMGEMIFQFNPKGNQIADISISVYLNDPSSINNMVATDRQFEINAYDAQGNVIELTEPMRIRLVYSKEEIDYVMSQAGLTEIQELNYVKNDATCGQEYRPEDESISLSVLNFGLGGEESVVLETEVDSFSSFFATASQSAFLPVTWGEFTASEKSSLVELLWGTYTEKNSSHFNIERSQDGLEWSTIGAVSANGFSTTQKNYTFYDLQPMQGVNYYRLNQVDFDGSSEYSKVISVSLFSDSGNIVFYRDNQLLITPNSKSNISVYTINGELVVQQNNITNRESINVSNLAKGIYVVVCEGSNKEVVKVAIR